MPHWFEQYMVSVPEGRSGDWRIVRDQPSQLTALREAMIGRGMPTDVEYTRLTRRGTVWMSDTPAEIRDHLDAFRRVGMPTTTSVLIAGMGIGMTLQHALRNPAVQQVTVVELESDVLVLTGEHYGKMAADNGVGLEIVEADVFAWKPPAGQRWDVAWFDVWADICVDNLGEMTTLHRRFARRAGWQGSWSHDELKRLRRRGAWR